MTRTLLVRVMNESITLYIASSPGAKVSVTVVTDSRIGKVGSEDGIQLF
jgi:hypothetical protein